MRKPREHLSARMLAIVAGSVLLAQLSHWVRMNSWQASPVMGLLLEVQLFAVSLIFLVRRRWEVALLALLLSPVDIRFWGGVCRYARGKAFYFAWGSSKSGGNLDPVLRVPLVTTRSAPSTLEWWLWRAPQNAAVSLCFSALGRMPGAYDGPLPSSDYAASSDEMERVEDILYKSHSDVQLSLFRGNAVRVGDVLVNVRPDVGPRMLQAATGGAMDEKCLFDATAQVALWRDRVLIVAMPSVLECNAIMTKSNDWSSLFAAAIDARSGRVLGYYHVNSLLGNSAAHLAGVWHLESYGNAP